MAEMDCYFYYYSTCTKGDNCPFRHCEAALGTETVCELWKVGKCNRSNCKFRHMESKIDRSMIPCYWEKQPGGCLKPHCVFFHKTRHPIKEKSLILPLASGSTSSSPEQKVNKTNAFSPNVDTREIAVMTPTVPTALVPPVVVTLNDGEESDTESSYGMNGNNDKKRTAAKRRSIQPNENNDDFGIKTLEQLRMEKIHRESEHFYKSDDAIVDTPEVSNVNSMGFDLTGFVASDDAEMAECEDSADGDLRDILKRRKILSLPVSKKADNIEPGKRLITLKRSFIEAESIGNPSALTVTLSKQKKQESAPFKIKTLDEIRLAKTKPKREIEVEEVESEPIEPPQKSPIRSIATVKSLIQAPIKLVTTVKSQIQAPMRSVAVVEPTKVERKLRVKRPSLQLYQVNKPNGTSEVKENTLASTIHVRTSSSEDESAVVQKSRTIDLALRDDLQETTSQNNSRQFLKVQRPSVVHKVSDDRLHCQEKSDDQEKKGISIKRSLTEAGISLFLRRQLPIKSTIVNPDSGNSLSSSKPTTLENPKIFSLTRKVPLKSDRVPFRIRMEKEIVRRYDVPSPSEKQFVSKEVERYDVHSSSVPQLDTAEVGGHGSSVSALDIEEVGGHCPSESLLDNEEVEGYNRHSPSEARSDNEESGGGYDDKNQEVPECDMVLVKKSVVRPSLSGDVDDFLNHDEPDDELEVTYDDDDDDKDDGDILSQIDELLKS